jgi:DNA-binding NarL/FixJ family response regulator
MYNIAEGCTRKEIAELLHRSEETIKTHRKNLFVKFGVGNTVKLVKKVYEMKLIR